LSSAQGSLNAGTITFIDSDTATDILKVAGGALGFDDNIYGYGGNDTLEGGEGNDLIDGGVGNDILDGETGNDRLFGGNETDQLFGREGNDTLNGGLGGDRMTGGIGDDTYYVDNVYDAVLEVSGQGTDTVFSSISYALPGPVENLTLTGSATINATGNGLKNILTGNSAANALDGGGWDDIIDGKGGADTLIGGAGFDTFVFHKGEANDDIIQDFTGYGKAFGDKIVFEDYGADAHLVKLTSAIYAIVDDESVELITTKESVDVSDYLFV
jgi:Ca2+-binding RTX toxin-like protein